MIITVTLNPAVDKTVMIPNFTINQVNRIASARMDAGGKGINVSKTIQALGGTSLSIAIVGGDTGAFIEQSLCDMGIECSFVRTEQTTRTNLKIIDLTGKTNTDINDSGEAILPQTLLAVQAKLLEVVRQDDIVVFAGRAPQGCAIETITGWMQECRDTGARVFLDADGEMLRKGVLQQPYLIKPNQHELEEMVGQKLTTKEQLLQAGKELVGQGVQNVIISMGVDGAIFINKQSATYAQGLRVPVVSTVGAGDAVMAAMAFGIEQRQPWEQVIRMAMASGAAKVSCSGTQAASWKSVAELMKAVVLTSN